MKTYFTGQPCKYGHVTERWVTNFTCTTCHTKQVIEWRKDNPEKTLELGRAQLNRHRAAVNRRKKERYAANPEKYRAEARDFWKNASEQQKQRCRERQVGLSAWYRAYKKRYRVENREKVNALNNRYRARRMAAGDHHTAQELCDLWNRVPHRCASCSIRLTLATRHRDNIQPLSKGGSNSIRNIQFLCRRCNSSKGPKDPIEFARTKGMLL